jgi:hypothetical protein
MKPTIDSGHCMMAACHIPTFRPDPPKQALKAGTPDCRAPTLTLLTTPFRSAAETQDPSLSDGRPHRRQAHSDILAVGAAHPSLRHKQGTEGLPQGALQDGVRQTPQDGKEAGKEMMETNYLKRRRTVALAEPASAEE